MSGKKPSSGREISVLDGIWDEIIENQAEPGSSTVDFSVDVLIVTQQELESALSDEFESVELMPIVSVNERGEISVEYVALTQEGCSG